MGARSDKGRNEDMPVAPNVEIAGPSVALIPSVYNKAPQLRSAMLLSLLGKKTKVLLDGHFS